MGSGTRLYPIPEGAFSVSREFDAATAAGAPPTSPFNTDLSMLSVPAGRRAKILGATISAGGILGNFAAAGTDFVRVRVRIGAAIVLTHVSVYDAAVATPIVAGPASFVGVFEGLDGADVIFRCDTDEMGGAGDRTQIYLASVTAWGIVE